MSNWTHVAGIIRVDGMDMDMEGRRGRRGF